MFKKTNPLQSKSEIILRNIVVLAMVIFFTVVGTVALGDFGSYWNRFCRKLS